MRIALWCPSLGLACGIAQYTTDLASGFTAADEVVLTPEPRLDVDVLHVQHEFGIFPQSGMLAYTLQEARRAGVTVVLTLHTVLPRAETYEQYCHGYAALTRRGAAWLQERHPGRPVAHLPLGCPPPRPLRPRLGAGRVGAHGFLERDKGYWALADAVGQTPASGAVVYAHPRRTALVADWTQHIADKPVTWVPDHLPQATLLDRLHDECDLVVAWRDELPQREHRPLVASASASLALALAAGLPVLARDTTWACDVGEAVYRPHDLAQGITDLLTWPHLRRVKAELARRYCLDHQWPAIAARHLAFYRSLQEG